MKNGSYKGLDYSDFNGENGTGGLLIIFSKTLTNYGTISSNGSKGGNARQASGGGSGGGSVNIFSNKIKMAGNIVANAGSGGSCTSSTCGIRRFRRSWICKCDGNRKIWIIKIK